MDENKELNSEYELQLKKKNTKAKHTNRNEQNTTGSYVMFF